MKVNTETDEIKPGTLILVTFEDGSSLPMKFLKKDFSGFQATMGGQVMSYKHSEVEIYENNRS